MTDPYPPAGPTPWDGQQPSAMQPYQQPYPGQPGDAYPVQPGGYPAQPGGYPGQPGGAYPVQPGGYPGQPGYGYPQPAPSVGYPPVAVPGAYGVDPFTGVAWSDKSKTTAGLLQLLLPLVGVCGVGRLYSGQLAIGLLQLIGFFVGWLLTAVFVGFLVVPAIWLWSVIDGIVLLSSGGRDQYGRVLR